jgi:MarR-like DNA-binding transcriptional regulator SgrR of sgrS sRNA
VAAVMSDYVGEENAVRLDVLCGRLSMDERKVRIILGRLVTE